MEIYKATSQITKKSYIGLSEDTDCRKQYHNYAARDRSQTHFHRAVRKYGIDTFEWSVLAECETREEAGSLETQFIEKYDTFNSGYNSTTGGERGWTHTEETRNKMSKLKIGKKRKPFTKETKERMSKAQLGTKHSAERIQKNSDVHKGQLAWNKGRIGEFGWFTDGQKTKYIRINEAPAEWRRGRKIKENKIGR